MQTKLKNLAEVSKKIYKSPNAEAVLQVTADQAREMLGCALVVAAAQPPHKAIAAPDMWEPLSLKVVAAMTPTLDAADELLAQDQAKESLATGQPQRLDNLLIVPLIWANDSCAGLLIAQNKQNGHFDEIDEASLIQLAHMCVIAIENQAFAQDKREAEERFRLAFNNTLVGMTISLRDQRLIEVNEAFCNITGFERDELLSKTLLDLTHPDDRPANAALYADLLAGKIDHFTIEKRYIRKNGSISWVRKRAAAMRDTEGNTLSTTAIIEDITARRDAEKVIAEKQHLLLQAQEINSRIVEHSPDIIASIDRDGHLLEVSPRCLEITGFKNNELVGKSFYDLLVQDDVTQARQHVSTLSQDNRAAVFEARLIHRKDHLVPILWSFVWTGFDDQYFCIGRDLTERVEMDTRLRQSQRLEAVGRLTGGVAHDFNNLLTVILGNAEMLVDYLADNEDKRRIAEMTRTAAVRGAELTNRLLAFARRQSLEPQTVNCNKLLADMEGLLRRTLRENIEIEFVQSGGLWPALIDKTQLEAAILNLCINARDAMPGSGKLTIETANTRLDDIYANQHEEVLAGQYVMIAVSDTGTGMDEEVLSRAFEPFFTTKEMGQGSGLGLSMVYGFAKQSGGHVKIYTELGVGTAVKIYVPRAEHDETSTTMDVISNTTPKGNECILLVEDDELVRTYVTEQLKQLGYRVTAVSNGTDALEALKQMANFDLLFTDVVMPGGMNGRELAEQALLLRPDIRVLFTSGYTQNSIVHHGRLDPGVHLLNKPYRRHDLATKIRLVLDEKWDEI